jgi:cytochrome c oxidase subunit 1/cytochrome c oxidase subunit I+III
MTGRMMSERLGRWGFWTIFIGFNVAFLPMHVTGLMGMPRRIYTYPDGMGWSGLNLTTSIGACILAFGLLLFLINVFVSRARGEPAGPNPWDGPTLEWATASPPPPYNFAVLPVVASRHPLWEERLQEGIGHSSVHRGLVLAEGREQLAVTPLDGEPNLIAKMPGDSLAPLVLTLAISGGFVALLLHAWWVAALFGAGAIATLIVWLWPERSLGQTAATRSEHG